MGYLPRRFDRLPPSLGRPFTSSAVVSDREWCRAEFFERVREVVLDAAFLDRVGVNVPVGVDEYLHVSFLSVKFQLGIATIYSPEAEVPSAPGRCPYGRTSRRGGGRSPVEVRVMAIADVRSLWVANAMVFGAGVGLTVGVALGGGAFIAPGLLIGASIGVVFGAAAAARRPPAPR